MLSTKYDWLQKRLSKYLTIADIFSVPVVTFDNLQVLTTSSSSTYSIPMSSLANHVCCYNLLGTPIFKIETDEKNASIDHCC